MDGLMAKLHYILKGGCDIFVDRIEMAMKMMKMWCEPRRAL